MPKKLAGVMNASRGFADSTDIPSLKYVLERSPSHYKVHEKNSSVK
jgi:hypothetical protein